MVLVLDCSPSPTLNAAQLCSQLHRLTFALRRPTIVAVAVLDMIWRLFFFRLINPNLEGKQGGGEEGAACLQSVWC